MTNQTKTLLRKKMMELRASISNRESKTKALNNRLIEHPLIKGANCIGLYAAIGDELSLNGISAYLHETEKDVCLPIVIANGQPLKFRKWFKEDSLREEKFNIPCPPIANEYVIPDVVIVPLLAFDREKYRLGYGGGFYDRTLEKLRASSQVYTIGVGFDEQQINPIPINEFDQKLDCLVTPSKSI